MLANAQIPSRQKERKREERGKENKLDGHLIYRIPAPCRSFIALVKQAQEVKENQKKGTRKIRS
jgi:hypothetical protein